MKGWVKWDRYQYMPVPNSKDMWFRWELKVGGTFDIIHEDEVPDQVWAELAKQALLR